MTTDDLIFPQRVDTRILMNWKFNKQHGDISTLVKLTGRTRKEISDALNFGFADAELQAKINEHYSKYSPY